MSHSMLLYYVFLFFLSFASSTISSYLNTSLTTHICSAQQSQTLLLFKQSLSSINFNLDGTFFDSSFETHYPPCWLGSGGYYPKLMNWDKSTDCCDWNGVTCDPSTGDVIGLDLSCGMLQGTIHPNTSLFHLSHLQRLNLGFNDFSGSQIPREIGRFSNSLTHFNISLSGFYDQVPTEITLLHNLVSLDLSLNYICLAPRVFENVLRNSTSLKEISLASVIISSVLPNYINISSSSLKLLNLRGAGLHGKFPGYIFNIQSLEILDLSENQFTGQIPLEISLPKSPPNLTHLTDLYLSDNKLDGTLPYWLFTLPSLKSLFLYGNMFSGDVPLGQNQLGGQIDQGPILQLTNLTQLDLSFNNFSGDWELDTLLSSLTNLSFLDLSYSGLSVTTNNANHHVNPNFRYLCLASCKIKVFPEAIRSMINLERLDLSRNEIHGDIPIWVGEMGGNKLRYLNLSYNFITGVPQLQWYGLTQLYLQSNMIMGPFPQSICNMSLLSLDLSNNSFGGVIPQCLGNITFLPCMMNLGNNDFQGTIPDMFDGCREIEGLILNGNQLQGELPNSLSNCYSLRVLDLANNHLNGTFPDWLGGLSELQVLNLKSNNFHGPIVTSPLDEDEFSFPSLRVLDLSHNGFVGQLPRKYFQNFNAMIGSVERNKTLEYLNMGNLYYSVIMTVKGQELRFSKISVDYMIVDLSNNGFEGEIPNIIGTLSSLIVLNLSHNNLTGQIPHLIGNLKEIESLDLSCNRLTGEIPPSLVDITNLEFLNLSENNLAGHIPEGKQFSTFNMNSFQGNPRLCGFPLPNKCTEHPHEPHSEDDEVENGFTWRVVMMGYGCGTFVGLLMGYLMLSTGRPKWFNAIADAGEHLIHTRRPNRRYIYIGK